MMRSKHFATVLFTALFSFGCITHTIAQQSTTKKLIEPIRGKLMLVGAGELSSRARATFAYLAEAREGSFVILSRPDKHEHETRLKWQAVVENVDPSSERVGDPVVVRKGQKYDLRHRKRIH